MPNFKFKSAVTSPAIIPAIKAENMPNHGLKPHRIMTPQTVEPNRNEPSTVKSGKSRILNDK